MAGRRAVDDPALVGGAVGVGDLARPRLNAGLPVAGIAGAVGPGKRARALALAADEAPLVAAAVGVDRDPLALRPSLVPLALVAAALGIRDLALALRLAGEKQALVDRPVGERRPALALDPALDPVAGVFVAVGQPVGAVPLLVAVDELALVDPAVVVFLGQDLRLHGRGAQCERRQRGGGAECGGADCGASHQVGLPGAGARRRSAPGRPWRRGAADHKGAGVVATMAFQSVQSSTPRISSSDQPRWWAISCTSTWATRRSRPTSPRSIHSSRIGRRNSQTASGRVG